MLILRRALVTFAYDFSKENSNLVNICGCEEVKSKDLYWRDDFLTWRGARVVE